MTPRIKYARSTDGVSIACYAIGDGSPLVYLTPGSHLEREWAYPEQRRWLERLASRHRVVRLDLRGTGLSDRDAPFSPELAIRDIEAVRRSEGLTRFAIMGQLFTAATAMLYASAYPDAVAGLLLWRPYARVRDLLESSPALQAARAAGEFDWITYTELIAQHATGWSDADQSRRYAAYLRESVSGEQYRRAVALLRDFDLTPRLAALTMPALILHRRDTAFPTIDVVRKLASHMPAARLVLLGGAAGVPFLGDTEAVAEAIEEFLAEHGRAQPPDGITGRELEILTLLAGGSSNEDIARRLTISTRTVERHIGNIYRKIGAHNRAEATAYAFRHGLAGRS